MLRKFVPGNIIDSLIHQDKFVIRNWIGTCGLSELFSFYSMVSLSEEKKLLINARTIADKYLKFDRDGSARKVTRAKDLPDVVNRLINCKSDLPEFDCTSRIMKEIT